MFYALASGLIDTGDLEYVHELQDIETLNRRALKGELEVTAVSIHAYAYLADRYALLGSGSSMGDGYGPRLVAISPVPADPKGAIAGQRVAVPGTMTTAYLALRLYQPAFEPVVMPFDQIEDAVLRGDADCGLLIHEGRFTYERKGLTLLCDLGTIWEQRMRCPLPLAAIAIRRDLAPQLAPIVDGALRASVEYAFAHPDASRDYVSSLAQEMDPDVTARHIQLYVNDYTRTLDERAVGRMLEWGQQQGLFPRADHSVAVFVPAAADA